MFEFKGPYINPDSAIYYSGIQVPDKIVSEIKKLENKRFIIKLNDKVEFPGTIIPVETGIYIVLVNKERVRKLKLSLGDTVQVNLIHDESTYGMPIPEEFQEVLNEDPEGKEALESLTPGKIRSLIYIVSKFKSAEKRIEKSVVILDHLKANNGKLDMKMLNVAFKEYGKR